MAHHGGDPSLLAFAFVDKELFSLSQIVDRFIGAGKELIFPTEELGERIRLNLNFSAIVRSQKLNPREWGRLAYEDTNFLPGISWLPAPPRIGGEIEQAYYDVSTSPTQTSSSFLGCLGRMAHLRGFEVLFEYDEAARLGRVRRSGLKVLGTAVRIRSKKKVPASAMPNKDS